jgi:hypothetical protein
MQCQTKKKTKVTTKVEAEKTVNNPAASKVVADLAAVADRRVAAVQAQAETASVLRSEEQGELKTRPALCLFIVSAFLRVVPTGN